MPDLWDQAGDYRWFSRIIFGAAKMDERNRCNDYKQQSPNRRQEQADVHSGSKRSLQNGIVDFR